MYVISIFKCSNFWLNPPFRLYDLWNCVRLYTRWAVSHCKSSFWSHVICFFFREASPLLHPSSQLEACSWQTVRQPPVPSSSALSGLLLSQRDKRADKDFNGTHSLALESTDVRYLTDQPALGALRAVEHPMSLSGTRVPAEEESTPKAQRNMDSQLSSPSVTATPNMSRRGESTPSTSPGSASQRLQNLRRHQPDDKLEKLKERIRRQRKHLEEAADRERLLGFLEQPIMATVGSNTGANLPTAKIRKVAAAPPAPIYKGNMSSEIWEVIFSEFMFVCIKYHVFFVGFFTSGFNSTETNLQTPDGKVWKEEDFQHLSIKIYRDLSRQIAGKKIAKHFQSSTFFVQFHLDFFPFCMFCW